MNNQAIAELLSAVATELGRLDDEESFVVLTDDAYVTLLTNRITLAGLGMLASRFYAPAQALGVAAISGAINDLTPEIVEFYDDGRGIRRLDRYLASRGWYAPHDDDATHLTRRAFALARVRAYQILSAARPLLDGSRITKADAQALIDAVIPHRHALAFLHVVPAKFAAETPPQCAQPLREVSAMVEAMGGECSTLTTRGVRDLVLGFSHLDTYAELRRVAARMVQGDVVELDAPTPVTRRQYKREEQRAQAAAMVAGGMTWDAVAVALGVSRRTIGNLLKKP